MHTLTLTLSSSHSCKALPTTLTTLVTSAATLTCLYLPLTMLHHGGSTDSARDRVTGFSSVTVNGAVMAVGDSAQTGHFHVQVESTHRITVATRQLSSSNLTEGVPLLNMLSCSVSSRPIACTRATSHTGMDCSCTSVTMPLPTAPSALSSTRGSFVLPAWPASTAYDLGTWPWHSSKGGLSGCSTQSQ